MLFAAAADKLEIQFGLYASVGIHGRSSAYWKVSDELESDSKAF